jgi:hypothetical protein
MHAEQRKKKKREPVMQRKKKRACQTTCRPSQPGKPEQGTILYSNQSKQYS